MIISNFIDIEELSEMKKIAYTIRSSSWEEFIEIQPTHFRDFADDLEEQGSYGTVNWD